MALCEDSYSFRLRYVYGYGWLAQFFDENGNESGSYQGASICDGIIRAAGQARATSAARVEAHRGIRASTRKAGDAKSTIRSITTLLEKLKRDLS